MINKKKMIYVLIQIFILFMTMILFSFSKISIEKVTFINISRYGLLVIVILIILNYLYYKKIITAYMIIFFSFCLFQFGVPILYAVNTKYNNFYIEVQSIENLIVSAKYSIICIQTFNLGGSLLAKSINRNNIQKEIFRERKLIAKVAKILFIATGVIAIPLAIRLLILSIEYGYAYIKVDSMGIYNPVNKLAKTFFVPSAFLWLVYCDNKVIKKILLTIITIYSIISMASGGRTEGLAILLVILYYLANNNLKSKKFLRNILLLFGGVGLLFSLTYIAQQRISGDGEFSILLGIQKTFEEMGFNFTSIVFTRDYIPNSISYQLGSSYINSLICLIPKSLDPTGTILNLYNSLPELWLADQLYQSYSGLYEFGVGYSIVAESYYNFGKFGWGAVLIIGMIIQILVGRDYHSLTSFRKYIHLVMLSSLITFPRRSFYELMKSIEYNVFIILIIVFFAQQFYYKKYLRGINNI